MKQSERAEIQGALSLIAFLRSIIVPIWLGAILNSAQTFSRSKYYSIRAVFLKTTWRFGFSYYGRVTTQNASKRRVFTALFLVNKRSSDISRASKPRKRFRCSERYETPPQAHGGSMSHLGFVDPLRRDVRLLGSFSLHLFLASPSSPQGPSLVLH